MSGYAVAQIDEIDEISDGRCPWRPVRHHFGITSFGVNAFTGKNAGDRLINEHDESQDQDLQEELYLGNLDAKRDWGFAGDYVRAMWLMLQHDEPGDYVVATGESHSVEELVACAFDAVSLDWRDHVRSDPSLYRGSAELHDLVGDASKARRVLGWEPKVRLGELMRMMVGADRVRLQAGSAAS